MTTIYQYRLWCNTENAYVTVWGEEPPTTCPHDTTHSIDLSSIVVVETKNTPAVAVQSDVIGYYQATTIPITVPGLNPGTVYTQDISFPHDTYIWTCEFQSDSLMVGDVFNVIVSPDTTVGYITQNELTGSNVLHVSQTIFSSNIVANGMHVSITDGATSQNLGRIISMDSVSETITVEHPLSHNFNTGNLLNISIYLIRDQFIGYSNKNYVYGKKGFSARKLPKNTIMRFAYTNNTGTPKQLNFDMEYNYA